MKYSLVFVSNYINHHQIPFCNAMYRELKGDFLFIQTEPMEEERVKMGWQEGSKHSPESKHSSEKLPYLALYYEKPEICQKYILEGEIVLFGGSDEESYIAPRLRAGRPVIRYSERLYKTGQWKAVSPRGLRKKFIDHTRYRSKQVYLLCAGAYVPSDFHIVRAYPDKMFRWGYFPETRIYDVDQLMKKKDKDMEEGHSTVSLLWAARFIDWKHPELPVLTAKRLKEKGIGFHLDMIGGGELEGTVKDLVKKFRLEDHITLRGYQPPEAVREYMERADIYLVTSDRQEGWGAVVNEAMNSGCAVVCNHMVGAAPYLIRHGENGLVYEDGKEEELFGLAEQLAGDIDKCRRLGRRAYETITREWNAENAAVCLLDLIKDLGLLNNLTVEKGNLSAEERDHRREAVRSPAGPCSPAPVIAERKMYRCLKGGTHGKVAFD